MEIQKIGRKVRNVDMHEEIIHFPGGCRKEAFQIQMCGKSYCDGSYRIYREKSNLYCIEYIYKGKGQVLIDGQQFTAVAGDIYILPVDKEHLYYSDDKNPWEKIWFNIRGDFVTNTLKAYGLEHVYHIRGLDLSRQFEAFVSCAEECMKQENIQEAFEKGAVKFLEIIQKIADAPELKEKMEEPGKVELLKKKIENLTDFRQSFDEILEEFFYTKSYMIRAFKEAYGITPYNYLLECKMSTAKSLLRNTAMSISEMSNYLGFANAHYFSNFFSKREGISPKEYRMSLVTPMKKE